jgi:hypothetical protein
MSPTKFQFQNAKEFRSGGNDLPSAVEATLKEFQKVAADNLRRGEGSIVTSVVSPKEGAYFAIVLAGPFDNLGTLQDSLKDSAEQMPIHLDRLGFK